MKRILKTAAAMLAAVALLVSFGAMGVFAEGEEWTDADTEQLLEYLEEYGADIPTATDVSGTDVSGTDVSASDVIGTTSVKLLREYDLTESVFKEYGVKVLTPNLEKMGNIYSDVDELSNALGSAVGPTALFDISYGGFSNYIIYGLSADSNIMMALTYTESNWSRFVGNYSNLSAEDQERIEAGTDLMGLGNGTTASFRVINGTPCLCQEYYDAEYTSMVYIVQAIVDGGIYEMYLQVGNPGDADFDVAEEIINSLEIKGMNTQRYGVASTSATTWLIALVAVLFAIVALLAFFVIRFSLFAKASGSEFNIIGFNLPEKNNE